MNFEARLNKLETALSAETGDDTKTIFINFVDPGDLDRRVSNASYKGQSYERLASEDEDAFLCRVRRDVEAMPLEAGKTGRLIFLNSNF